MIAPERDTCASRVQRMRGANVVVCPPLRSGACSPPSSSPPSPSRRTHSRSPTGPPATSRPSSPSRARSRPPSSVASSTRGARPTLRTGSQRRAGATSCAGPTRSGRSGRSPNAASSRARPWRLRGRFTSTATSRWTGARTRARWWRAAPSLDLLRRVPHRVTPRRRRRLADGPRHGERARVSRPASVPPRAHRGGRGAAPRARGSPRARRRWAGSSGTRPRRRRRYRAWRRSRCTGRTTGSDRRGRT